MAEGNSAVVAWTAIAALVLSLSTAGYALYRAARGPNVEAFPVEDVMLFAYPDSGPGGELAAAAKFDLANTSPDYPDILVSEVLRIQKDGAPVACLSERGEVVYEQPDLPPAAPSLPAAADAATPETLATRKPSRIDGAAETISLKYFVIGVFDTSSRAGLRPGDVLSRRQLFDQKASGSGVDPCYQSGARATYTVDRLLTDFPSGSKLDLLYEARFAQSPGLTVSCMVEMTERRVAYLKDNREINFACNASTAAHVADEGPLSGFFRFLGRIF